ncbi:MAG: hypothetical protein WBQ73_03455 [Candidatus Babeliales bacterium]
MGYAYLGFRYNKKDINEKTIEYHWNKFIEIKKIMDEFEQRFQDYCKDNPKLTNKDKYMYLSINSNFIDLLEHEHGCDHENDCTLHHSALHFLTKMLKKLKHEVRCRAVEKL